MKKTFIKPEIQVMNLYLEEGIASDPNRNQTCTFGNCHSGIGSSKPENSCSTNLNCVEECPYGPPKIDGGGDDDGGGGGAEGSNTDF
jgi:hypothetical protein